MLYPSDNPNQLKCQGFIIDLIDGHGCNCQHQNDQTHVHDVVPPITLVQPYKSVEDIKDAIWNAILGGRKEHDVSDEHYKFFLGIPWLSRSFLDRHFENAQLWVIDRIQQCNVMVDIAGRYLPYYFSNTNPDFKVPTPLAEGDPDITQIFSDIIGRLVIRKLFTTWRGYIGMRPPNVRQEISLVSSQDVTFRLF